MKIQEFIAEHVFLPRVRDHQVLVVYDANKLYREICLGMATKDRTIVDASESSLTSREAAITALANLAHGGQLLIYVPAPAPITDEDKQHDPFSSMGACGSVFPKSDGEDYFNLCLKAKADNTTEVRKVFAQDPLPSFAVINNIGGGLQWPTLRDTLQVESSSEIIETLLAPSTIQRETLDKSNAWIEEAKQLFQQVLGLKLLTKSQKWKPIADELWRFVLFSEFVFDLPGDLPEKLTQIPRASEAARPVIERVCDRMRNNVHEHAAYIQYAEQIERDLELEHICHDINDLGQRDTFPFEERSFLYRVIKTLEKDATDLESLNHIIDNRTKSIWRERGEHETQWGLIAAAGTLITVCADLQRQLKEHTQSQAALIDFYLARLRSADRSQREFEQAVSDYIDDEGLLHLIISRARRAYGQLSSQAQLIFTRHLEQSGWPPQGHLANADVFDRLVSPCLQISGQRVAYIMVDALRYELGQALEEQIQGLNKKVRLQAAFAQLPTITVIGMASLLPGAGKDLSIVKTDDGFEPRLNGSLVDTVSKRMAVFKQKYGDRFTQQKVDEFVQDKRNLDKAVELVVLRSYDIDSLFENTPQHAPSAILKELRLLLSAIKKLEKQGFHKVFIVTDHGFFLNGQAESGDTCPKPAGNWIMTHDRCGLGSGRGDDHHFVISANQVGIKGDFQQLVGPKTMAAYVKNKRYFHGGVSLQECIVPVIEVDLEPGTSADESPPEVQLVYKNGKKLITSRRPIFEVNLLGQESLLAQRSVELLLEATDESNNVIGEAKTGGPVNAATRIIRIEQGQTIKVTMIMDDDFEGTFTIRAVNPLTQGEYTKLKLKTDYAV